MTDIILSEVQRFYSSATRSFVVCMKGQNDVIVFYLISHTSVNYDVRIITRCHVVFGRNWVKLDLSFWGIRFRKNADERVLRETNFF